MRISATALRSHPVSVRKTSPRSIASRSISSSTNGLPSLRSCRKSRNSSLIERSSKIAHTIGGDLLRGQRTQVDELDLTAAPPPLNGRQQRVLTVHLVGA